MTRLANKARIQNTIWAGLPNLAYTIWKKNKARIQNTTWAGLPNLAYTIWKKNKARIQNKLCGLASQT